MTTNERLDLDEGGNPVGWSRAILLFYIQKMYNLS